MKATIHRVRHARRRLRGHLPSRDPRRSTPNYSRWLPTIVHDPSGRALGSGFRPGYLHPTKGLRLGDVPPGFRGVLA